MLASMFPRAHARYTSLPVLGGSLEGLCSWLHTRGYPRDAIQRRMQAAASLARAFRRRGVRSLHELTLSALLSYAPPPRMSNSPPRGALVRSLIQYMAARGELRPTAPTATERQVADYQRYLERVRGLSAGTVKMHGATITAFLMFLEHDACPERLPKLRADDVEAFITKSSALISRSRLGYVTTALRTFLRYLAVTGVVPPDLAAHVESPRVYRGERLPRALPWETVRALLRSIDRTTPKGLRDYAIFVLVASYGLRASEVRALDLDDIAWRARQIRVPRPKAGTPLLLPLTDEVATALLDYLRRGRPRSTCRRLFLRVEAPLGPLGQGAITDAFAAWAQRAGIPLPARSGPHCIRHALALHLLREGASLKAIGDLLGHRTAESTGVYLRLDVDDLRQVALPLPSAAVAVEVRS